MRERGERRDALGNEGCVHRGGTEEGMTMKQKQQKTRATTRKPICRSVKYVNADVKAKGNPT